MTDGERLAMLKVDLGITTNAYDERLAQYLSTAQAEMEREGAEDDGSVDYSTWVIMYAAWLWRRRDTGEGMPRMLRYALNNLVFEQKVGNDG